MHVSKYLWQICSCVRVYPLSFNIFKFFLKSWNRKCASFSLLRNLITRLHLTFHSKLREKLETTGSHCTIIIISRILLVYYNANAVIWLAEPLHTISHQCEVPGTSLRNGDVLSFCQSFGGKFWWKWVIKFLRRLDEWHLRFLNFKKVETIEKNDARPYTT